MVVHVSEEHIDHGEPLEIVADRELVRHAHPAMKLDGFFADPFAGTADLHFGGRSCPRALTALEFLDRRGGAVGEGP